MEKEYKEYWLKYKGPHGLQKALEAWCQASFEMSLEEYQKSQLLSQIEQLTSRMDDPKESRQT